MRILLVNDYATPTGGAEIQMLALRDGLRRLGHDVRMFASSARPASGVSLAEWECLGTTSRFRTLLQTANPWAFHKMGRVLAEFRPDVVHVGIHLTQLSPLILPLLKQIPSLYHVHWHRPICPVGTKTLADGATCYLQAGLACYYKRCLPLRDWLPLMFQMKLWRHWRRVFKVIVAVSQALRRRLIEEAIEPVEVVWNGVPIRPPRPPLSSPPTVAFAGRLVWAKGPDVLLEAFAKTLKQIPEAHLLLVGDGSERKHLGSLISKLQVSSHVSMVGHLPRQEMESRLSAAWVQAVPSRCSEGFPLAGVEAMMRGTAVIASASGGLVEIVQDGKTGFLIPPGDVDALAEALRRLLLDRQLAEQMGAAGREVALARFGEPAFVDRFQDLYEAICR